jgi:hypothetical protein
MGVAVSVSKKNNYYFLDTIEKGGEISSPLL